MAEPLCAYFGKCGGCSSQHVDYKTQLENKKRLLANAIKYEDIRVFSGNEYNYRSRMDFIFHPNGLGLRKKKNWGGIIGITECRISNEKLNRLLAEAGGFFRNPDYFDVKRHTGALRYAVIRAPKSSSSISFVLNSESSRINEAADAIERFSKITSAENVIITYTDPQTDESISDDYYAVKGSDMLCESMHGKTFWYSIEGFFQNNTDMAEKMHAYCRELLKKYSTGDAELLDLYGGVGVFGIINADLFRKVFIVESVKQCIDAAEKNIKENKADNAEAVLLDAKQLKNLNFGKRLFVVADPPRSGMHPKTIEQLNRLKPEAIIYVSCNAEQLGKDIPKFKDYRLNSAAMFDFFPHTLHIEAVAELVLK